MIVYRSLTEDLVEILVGFSLRGPCMKFLRMPCLGGACESSCGSSRSFYDNLVRFSSGSWHEALGHGPVEILVA